MANQLNHKYELLFGQPYSFYGRTTEQPRFINNTPLLSNFAVTSEVTENVGQLVETKDAKGLRLDSHHITFKISKSKESGQQNTITIYNISDNVRQYLEAKAGEGVAIVLYAGYESEEQLNLIFQGQVVTVKDTFTGHTRVTEIVCRSGYKNMQEAYTVRSFRSGTRLRDIVTKTLDDLKLPIGTVYIPREADIIIDKPVVLNGKTKEVLDSIAAIRGMKVFVEDDTVNVIPLDSRGMEGTIGFRLSTKLGNIIGSPALLDDSAGTQEKEPSVRGSIKVVTTLNGAYQTGNLVEVDSRYFQGVYEIESIDHRGSYEGSEWVSELKLKPRDDWQVR
jgi:hypothetical protein